MIENLDQYEYTRECAARFEAMLAAAASEPPPATEQERAELAAETASARRILHTLRAEMREYESRQPGAPPTFAKAAVPPAATPPAYQKDSSPRNAPSPQNPAQPAAGATC